MNNASPMRSTLVIRVALIVSSLPIAAQDAVVPPESIISENIPPIPKSVAESVGRYTEFRAAGFRSWHPVKREMLIRTRFADTLQVHHVAFPLGARTQLTF